MEDPEKQRKASVSGSANRIYDEEVKITGDRYTSKDFMEKELSKLWSKVWNIGCWGRELEKEGDFVTHNIGRESILLVRNKHNKVSAFHNVCPHRGNRLVHVDAGFVSDFRCTYHGWKFNYEGELIYAQDDDDFPQGNPCGKLKLYEIPCEEYAGFIWYNMDKNCFPLKGFLGEITKYLDMYDNEG